MFYVLRTDFEYHRFTLSRTPAQPGAATLPLCATSSSGDANHLFVDGNKRIALPAMHTSLGLNGVDFIVPGADAAAMILSLAAGEVSEESLARWIRDNWPNKRK